MLGNILANNPATHGAPSILFRWDPKVTIGTTSSYLHDSLKHGETLNVARVKPTKVVLILENFDKGLNPKRGRDSLETSQHGDYCIWHGIEISECIAPETNGPWNSGQLAPSVAEFRGNRPGLTRHF